MEEAARECRQDASMQLLGKDPRTHRRALYNSNTTSSTSRILGKCAAFVAAVAFRFSTSVTVNSAAFFND